MRVGISGTRGTGKTTLAEARLRTAFTRLDLLVITPITPHTERMLPPPELPVLRTQVSDALLDLVYDGPLGAWEAIPVLELSGPLDGRLHAVPTALGIASG